jgi:hypothetical protein
VVRKCTKMYHLPFPKHLVFCQRVQGFTPVNEEQGEERSLSGRVTMIPHRSHIY